MTKPYKLLWTVNCGRLKIFWSTANGPQSTAACACNYNLLLTVDSGPLTKKTAITGQKKISEGLGDLEYGNKQDLGFRSSSFCFCCLFFVFVFYTGKDSSAVLTNDQFFLFTNIRLTLWGNRVEATTASTSFYHHHS